MDSSTSNSPSPIVIIERSALLEVVEEVVREAMRSEVPEAMRMARQPEWLSREQAKARYGLTSRQLTYLRRKRRIEYTQHGRRIFYRRASLDAYYEEGRVPPRKRDGE